MGSDNALFSKPSVARWTMEFLPGRGWRLVDPKGQPQAAVYSSRDLALTTLEAAQARTDVALKRTMRPCLCCGKPFQSEGIHNRMCTPCRGLNADGWNPYSLAPRSGRAR